MEIQCNEEGKVDQAQQLWDKIVETGNLPIVLLKSQCIKKKNGDWTDGTVRRGLEASAVTYTILMDGHFKKGEVDKAFKVFDEMVNRRIDRKAYTYNTIIHGLCRNGQTSRARKMLENFVEGGNFKPSFATYCFIIDGFYKEDDVDSALSVSAELSKTELRESNLYYESSVCGSVRQGKNARSLERVFSIY